MLNMKYNSDKRVNRMKKGGAARNRTTLARGLAYWVALCAFASLTSNALAAEPLALKKIMADLGQHMQNATYALSVEDYALVEKAALEIANHPAPPPAEFARIEEFLGKQMHQFEVYDEKTHNLSLALAKAARKKDGIAAITAFQKLQISCLACHKAFRKPIINRFYQP